MTASLAELTRRAGNLSERRLCAADACVGLDEIVSGWWLDAPVERLHGSSILIATSEQFATACALIACDGLARRMVICPPGLSSVHLRMIAQAAEIDTVLCDDPSASNLPSGIEAFAVRQFSIADASPLPDASFAAGDQAQPATEWILLTSGTSGAPKLVIHTLQTLTGAMTGGGAGTGLVWSTFYDIRRYGGLQIFLRAMVGGGTMILSNASEPTAAFLARAGSNGVTHMSGTPSHWRHALMSRPDRAFAPRYVRLSGEIADQAILDRLRTRFADAAIAHAFASTEAGVAFDVGDGQAGFPAALIGSAGPVAMRVEDGSLRIQSARTALGYLGHDSPPLGDREGFVDTGDMVQLHGDRYSFIGRRSGIINVGGLKIHPEKVEAMIFEHPRVRMCMVKARKSPIMGAIVIAEVVADRLETDPQSAAALVDEIVALCRSRLARHEVPVSLRLVTNFDMAVSGKMAR